MINIYQHTCIEEGCNILPSYNYEGLKNRLYCTFHKKENMISISSKKCIYDCCNVTPKYNFANEKIPLYCTKHKLENMVHLSLTYCKEDNCTTFPTFNYKGLSAQYCLKHKKENMINVVDKLCKECNTIASYNYKGETPKYCTNHKLQNMINIYAKYCKSDFCNIQIGKDNYKGYCFHCFVHIFPNEKIVRNYCTKEKEVVSFVKDNYNNYDWKFDKIIENGISRRRPDIFLNLDSQILIIEIDENQHNVYDCSCENKRIMELSTDVNYKPIVFIRFNPDSYINKNNDFIKSPWIYNKTIIQIAKKYTDEWNNRLKVLKDHIDYWILNNTNKTIEIIQLFYDQNIENTNL